MSRPGFYVTVLRAMRASGRPFLVGGTYALAKYAGMARRPKDLDLMICRNDWPAAARALRAAGIRTRLTFPHWLGKATDDRSHVDIIFNSGNGLTVVDETWFAAAVRARVLGISVLLTPPEELLWSKAFVMERERFDGADIQHLLLGLADRLDWRRLRDRFRGHERVLLVHLLLFGYVYPGQAGRIPEWIIADLWRAPIEAGDAPADADGAPLCRGPLLSRAQYLVDIRRFGFADARLAPRGSMTERERAIWTAPVERL
jgi:hypothetical protein